MEWQGWTSFIGTVVAQGKPILTFGGVRSSKIWHRCPVVSTAILQIRLYALYSKSRKLLAYMVACYVLSIVSSLVVVEKAINKIRVGQ